MLCGAALLLTTAGCDFIFKGDDGDEDQAEVYEADLTALNATGGIEAAEGTARLTIADGRFTARVTASSVKPGALHVQHIHATAECPPPSADTNGDGYIDVIEGVPFYGEILVPLDGDLSAQAAGAMGFPAANAEGQVDYTQSTSLDALLADLRAEDPNPDDAITRLGEGEDLGLEGRHVVVHGVSPDMELPSTVQTIGELPPQVSLPVACGPATQVQ